MKNHSFLLSVVAMAVSFFTLSVLANEEGMATPTDITEELCDTSWTMRQCLDSIATDVIEWTSEELTTWERILRAAKWDTTSTKCSGLTAIIVGGAREAAGIAFGNNMRDTTFGQPEVEYFFWGNPKDSEATGYHGAFRDPADDGSIDHLFLS